MKLTEAFQTLDHNALDIIYDNLPFLQTLSQTPKSTSLDPTNLQNRQIALAKALLLTCDLVNSKPGLTHTSASSADNDDGLVENDKKASAANQNPKPAAALNIVETPTRSTLLQKSQAQTSLLPSLPVNGTIGDSIVDVSVPSSNAKTTKYQTIIGLPAPTREQAAGMEDSPLAAATAAVTTPFSVPPTINPYDPVKDYLPTWLKRTYMYWRWTLKLPVHDIPQRYAVWISLHLNHPSIKYHLQSLVVLATSTSSPAKFKTSVDVNEYILKHAAGHIRVQEELAREEFCALRQPETMSIIAFNAQFLRVFSKIRHFYNQERLAIQYYDRIVPRVRKRLNVNFYERYTTTTSSGVFLEVPSQNDLIPESAAAGEKNNLFSDPHSQKRLSSPLDLSFSPTSPAYNRVSKTPGSSKRMVRDRERRYYRYPTLEALMLEAEQVDDFHRPLPPVPQSKKQGFLGALLMTSSSSQKHAAANTRQKQQRSLTVVDIYGGAANDTKSAAVVNGFTTYYDPPPSKVGNNTYSTKKREEKSNYNDTTSRHASKFLQQDNIITATSKKSSNKYKYKTT